MSETQTPLRDLVAGAQKHYLEISDEACHFNSLIPTALEFYETFSPVFKLMDEHIKNIPVFMFRSRSRNLRYKISNWLMGGVLSRTVKWYNELCELMGIDIEELIFLLAVTE